MRGGAETLDLCAPQACVISCPPPGSPESGQAAPDMFDQLQRSFREGKSPSVDSAAAPCLVAGKGSDE